METVEYEERVLISESDYQQVIKDIKEKGLTMESLLILNIYLDNKNEDIYKNGQMLRIRTTNGKNEELTLKIRNQDGSTREINETLKSHPIIDKELKGNFNDYHQVTRLTTERIEVRYDDYLLVIDKNTYGDVVDYDLEIEANSQQKAINLIEKYCILYDLTYDPHYKVKSRRAIEEVKKRMKLN